MFLTFNKAIVLALASFLFMSAAMADSHGKKLREKMGSGIQVQISVSGCDDDVKKYCDGLDPDSNKTILCLTAYEDKISTQCKQNITEATMAMKMGAAAIQHSAQACEADADKFCLDIEPGQGRIIGCIKQHESKVSKACVTALKETGLWNIDK